MMLPIEPRLSTSSMGSTDSDRFAVVEESEVEALQQRALVAERRAQELEAQLGESCAKQAEVELAVGKTASENEAMQQRLSELQRKLEMSTQQRHLLLLQEQEGHEGHSCIRCSALETETGMYKKYVNEMTVASEASQENAQMQQEFQEALEQQVSLLQQEKRELQGKVKALQMKWFYSMEHSVAQLETEELQRRLDDSASTAMPVGKTFSGDSVASTAAYSESSMGKTFSGSSTASSVVGRSPVYSTGPALFPGGANAPTSAAKTTAAVMWRSGVVSPSSILRRG